MLAYTLRRLLLIIPVMLIVATTVFLLLYPTPGDPVGVILGPDATEPQKAELRGRLGLVAGFFRGIDTPIMRFMDSMMAFPGIVLAIGLMAALGPSKYNVMTALTIVYTPRLARVMRSIVPSIREMQFVEAARAQGTSNPRSLRRHILPNCLSPLIVQGTFIFAEAVLGEASLSFLGAGTPPYIPSWGNMLGEARAYLRDAPWTMLFPGLSLTLTVLALNRLGDGIRDLLDPRVRKI